MKNSQGGRSQCDKDDCDNNEDDDIYFGDDDDDDHDGGGVDDGSYDHGAVVDDDGDDDDDVFLDVAFVPKGLIVAATSMSARLAVFSLDAAAVPGQADMVEGLASRSLF